MEKEVKLLLHFFIIFVSIIPTMANHVLSLEAPDTLNSKILRLVDTSVYEKSMSITCILLEVTVPGFNIPVQFTEADILPGFNLTLTTCDLTLQTSDCGSSYNDLSDGIYIIKLSVSPTDLVYVEYNHLRITKAMKRYQTILCELDINDCDPPEKIKNKMTQLRFIRMYLDAAKAKVEFCHEPVKGMELYRYAVKLLGKMDCKTCR